MQAPGVVPALRARQADPRAPFPELGATREVDGFLAKGALACDGRTPAPAVGPPATPACIASPGERWISAAGCHQLLAGQQARRRFHRRRCLELESRRHARSVCRQPEILRDDELDSQAAQRRRDFADLVG